MRPTAGILVTNIPCAVCSRSVTIGVEGSDKNIGVLCTYHKSLKREIVNPCSEIQTLRTDLQKATTVLALNAKEKHDLQAQVRALHYQLSEKESNQPLQKKLNKLEGKLKVVKQKLVQWNQLLTKHHG